VRPEIAGSIPIVQGVRSANKIGAAHVPTTASVPAANSVSPASAPKASVAAMTTAPLDAYASRISV
jgi:hypothetical protein